MAGKKPRQGWVYPINPYRVSLRCKQGHIHIYDLAEPGEVQCKTSFCNFSINSSRVFRGTHPHIIWTSDRFQDESSYITTFTVIPLTSQETYRGLPTTYPVKATTKNSLDRNSFALIHQIYTIDANCLKDSSGNWFERIGQLDKSDKEAIAERLNYYLGISDDPSEDWFLKNASPDLVKKVFGYLSEADKQSVISELIDDFDF